MSLFVDSSAWFAAADTGDNNNARAREILSAGERLVTTDHVLIESWPLLGHRLGRHIAERFWEGLRTGVATIETVRSADLEAAWALSETFADQDFSIADRTSFTVMIRSGIQRVASWDDDFAVFRFGPNRRRAFAVVR